MRFLGELTVPGSISALCWLTVRLVHEVRGIMSDRQHYRLRCEENRLRRDALQLGPGGQPAQVARALHACRRRKRR